MEKFTKISIPFRIQRFGLGGDKKNVECVSGLVDVAKKKISEALMKK